MGGSLEALIIYSEVFEKDLEDMVDSFFFLGMLQETLKRMVGPSKTFIKSVQFENVLGFLLL